MTLSAPTAVAFAVSGGTPADVREWITVDFVGQPSPYRRGFAVMTESLTLSGRGEELARHARALILQELRRHQRQPADAALARAFAVANSIVFEEGRFPGGIGQRYLIGATAIVFEGHQATIGHLPPGQLVLAQDGLVYAVPEIGSWLPHYAETQDDAPTPEPLGYASWTAPVLVQTELREGDTLILCTAKIGEGLAELSARPGGDQLSVSGFHGRDPDKVMDVLREVVIERELPVAAAAVIGFPPAERGSGVETIGDIGRNAREQWRHGRAAIRQFLPVRPSRAARPTVAAGVSAIDMSSGAGDLDDVVRVPAAGWRKPEESIQERLIRLTERRSGDWRDTWRQPSELRQLGAPGAHGISRYRDSSLGAGEPSWKHTMPRLPFLRSPVFIVLCVVALLGVSALLYTERGRFLPSEDDYMAHVAEADRQLLLARDTSNEDIVQDALDDAEAALADAERAGAPEELLSPRQNEITLERDAIQQVVRLADVTRIGGLPAALQSSRTRAIHTPGGIFLANGSLYRLRPESREMQLVLQSGSDVEGLQVGDLFGVAYDGETLVASDGQHVFFAGSAEGSAWQGMTLEEINQQGPWPPGPIAAFAENIYLLVPEYRNIYQFTLNPEEQRVGPMDWVLTGDRVTLNLAVDMTVDGNIYVLLEDGRVLTMRRGAQVASFDLPVFDPETETPLAIVSGPMTGYLYVAVVDDQGDGRVIAVDREGGHMSQLELPAGFSTGESDVLPPFDDLQDIAVDEASGTLYLVNGDAVWTARYSLPPLPVPAGTPPATPPVPQ
ncbi:MAG TPA: hypothetical protein VGR29_11095 [Thermomicrobiales bacterium]|nr:hypothetical protein [Thermomicrobiales bacterium]